MCPVLARDYHEVVTIVDRMGYTHPGLYTGTIWWEELDVWGHSIDPVVDRVYVIH
jgi:hypothetical protein